MSSYFIELYLLTVVGIFNENSEEVEDTIHDNTENTISDNNEDEKGRQHHWEI